MPRFQHLFQIPASFYFYDNKLTNYENKWKTMANNYENGKKE